MANELTVSISVTANKVPTLLNIARSLGISQDIAGARYEQAIQNFTTSPAQVVIGGITTLGYVLLRNTASANNLLCRLGSGGADLVKIRPGGVAFFECVGNTLFMSASTGTIDAEILAFDA